MPVCQTCLPCVLLSIRDLPYFQLMCQPRIHKFRQCLSSSYIHDDHDEGFLITTNNGPRDMDRVVLCFKCQKAACGCGCILMRDTWLRNACHQWLTTCIILHNLMVVHHPQYSMLHDTRPYNIFIHNILFTRNTALMQAKCQVQPSVQCYCHILQYGSDLLPKSKEYIYSLLLTCNSNRKRTLFFLVRFFKEFHGHLTPICHHKFG